MLAAPPGDDDPASRPFKPRRRTDRHHQAIELFGPHRPFPRNLFLPPQRAIALDHQAARLLLGEARWRRR